jgi:hypothetical protein
MRLRFCGTTARAITSDGGTTNDARRAKKDDDSEEQYWVRSFRAGRTPKDLMEEARENLKRAEEIYHAAEEYSETKIAAGEARREAKRKLDNLEFSFIDSAPKRVAHTEESAQAALLAAVNEGHAEHYARAGMPVPVEPIAALPPDYTLANVNQRNADFWGGKR